MKRLDALKIVVRALRKKRFGIGPLECELSDFVRDVFKIEVKAFRQALEMAKIFFQIRSVDDE